MTRLWTLLIVASFMLFTALAHAGNSCQGTNSATALLVADVGTSGGTSSQTDRDMGTSEPSDQGDFGTSTPDSMDRDRDSERSPGETGEDLAPGTSPGTSGRSPGMTTPGTGSR